MHSNELDKIAAALAKARTEIRHPARNSVGQARGGKYKYADLAAVIDATMPALAAVGITVVQTPEVLENGAQVLRTTLLHSSGQWIAATMELPTGAKSQDMGSALTYARRYSLAAITGVASEDDDDGSAAQAADTRPRQPQKPATQPAPQQASRANGYVARTEMVSRVADVLMKNYASLVRDWSGDTDAEVQRGNVLSLATSKLDELSVGDAPVPEDLLRELGSACKETMAKRSVEAA